MATTLKLGAIRSLIRLHRQQVDGATEALARLMETERDAIGAAFGLRTAPASHGHTERDVEQFIALVDGYGASKTAQARDRAQHLALRLASGCRASVRGVRLPVPWLDELVRAGGYETLAFRFDDEHVRGLGRTTVLALLRELRTMEITHAFLVNGCAIDIAYHGRIQRGSLRLRLDDIDANADAVIVDLGVLAPAPEPYDVPVPPPDKRRLTLRTAAYPHHAVAA